MVTVEEFNRLKKQGKTDQFGPPEPTPGEITTPQVIKNQDTGKVTGVKLPGGRTILGLSAKEARGEINAFNNKRATPQGGVNASDVKQQEQEQQQQEQAAQDLAPQLQEQGALDAPPQKQEFDTGPKTSDLPLFNLLNSLKRDQGILLDRKKGDIILERAQQLPPEQQEDFVRREVTRTIQQSDLGKSALTSMGKLIESLPVLGSLAATYAKGLSTPAGKAKANLDALNSLKSEIENWNERATINPQGALDEMDAYENRVDEYEYKIRLLILDSPLLQAQPEQVDKIEEEIFSARNRINRVRETAARNLIKREVEPASLSESISILEDLKNRNEKV